MKRIIITLTLLVAVFSFFSCEKETEDIATGTVNYPVFVNSGQQLNVIALGEAFEIPEVTVYDGSNDITSEAIVTGSIDPETPGYYEVNYTATTKDGYSGTYSVIVFVYDPGYKDAPIAGKYSGDRYGEGGGTVEIKEYNKGVYTISDVYCGFYAVAYEEPGWLCPAYLIYVGNDTFIIRNPANVSWYYPAIDTNGVSWDPETGVITYQLTRLQSYFTWDDKTWTLTPEVEE